MLPRVAFAALLTSALPIVRAQAPRLVDTIEAPLAYLCLEGANVPAGATGEGANAAGGVQRLLADPSLDVLFGSARTTEDASTRALSLIRGLLVRSSGELEIALTGVMSSSGTPLLVLRARLQPKEAEKLQRLFADPTFAAPQRELAGHPTFRLLGGEAASGPGQDVELAVVGHDLVAGNDGSAMREVLDPPPPVTSAERRHVLASDARFVSLKKQLRGSAATNDAGLGTGPGSLCIYGDWQRLASRVGGKLEGLPGEMLASSGLGQARAVMMAVSSPAGSAEQAGDFAASLVLDFGPGAFAPGDRSDRGDRGDRGEPRGPGFGRDHDHDHERAFGGIDGWFAAARPVPAKSLVGELPAGPGLGGLVLSVDFEAVAGRSHEGDHILHDLEKAFDEYGLSFDRNVRARLGSRGTVQFHLGRDVVASDPGNSGGTAVAGASTTVTSIFSLRAKDKKAAAGLFSDLRRVAEASGLGRLVPGGSPGKDRRVPDVLELHGRHPGDGFVLAVLDDSLLIGADVDTLVQVHDEFRRGSKPRSKRDQFVQSRVQAIGGENVAGLFDLDFGPLFEQVTQAFADAGAKVDLSQLPRRHVGYLDVVEPAAADKGSDKGATVRLRLLASR